MSAGFHKMTHAQLCAYSQLGALLKVWGLNGSPAHGQVDNRFTIDDDANLTGHFTTPLEATASLSFVACMLTVESPFDARFARRTHPIPMAMVQCFKEEINPALAE
jgi:hypothetical protein